MSILSNQVTQIGQDAVRLFTYLDSWQVFWSMALKIIFTIVFLVVEVIVIRVAYNASVPRMFEGAKKIGWIPAIGIAALFVFI